MGPAAYPRARRRAAASSAAPRAGAARGLGSGTAARPEEAIVGSMLYPNVTLSNSKAVLSQLSKTILRTFSV